MSNPASSDPVSIAIVGCGSIAPTHAKALAGLPGHYRLTHCCDQDRAKADVFAKQYGLQAIDWQALLDDSTIESISLCVPSGLHARLGAEALQNGKHVIIEKPMDATLEACDQLLAAHAAGDRILSIISQHRFDPGSQRVHGLLNENALGKPVLIDVNIPWYRTQEYYDSGDWRGTWAMDGGGCLMNQGVHTVDLMLWLCGPVKSVFARTRTAAHERIEVEDVVSASLEFANGAIGTLLASTACYPGFLAKLSIYGTDGTAVLEGDELVTLAIRGQEMQTGARGTAHALQIATGGTKSATAHSSPIPGPTTDGGWAWGDAHRAQFVDFFESVRSGRPPLVDGRSGRDAVALIKAVYESARTGQPVPL
ncbi:MAG: Gfo/Idh/MocA family oxidoreductase [Verrucomicrobiota bacterium]